MRSKAEQIKLQNLKNPPSILEGQLSLFSEEMMEKLVKESKELTEEEKLKNLKEMLLDFMV